MSELPIELTSEGAHLPIGVFDSGIGGLSVLNALLAELPSERFVYFADTAHAPYGERGDGYVIERARAVARHLLDTRHIKALVVACNTATAAAIHLLRSEYPTLVIVGIEPALKPAAQASRTRRIGVIATRGTLESRKFQALHASLAAQAEFVTQPCDGLAAAIENSDATKIIALCARYMGAMGTFGMEPGQIDTLVLGCTHYPFVTSELRRHTGDQIAFIDTGTPVALQTRRLLANGGKLATGSAQPVELLASGAPEALDLAAAHWLRAATTAARIVALPQPAVA